MTDYYNPGQTYLEHEARCKAVQRRGVQKRLETAIAAMTYVGQNNMTDEERETLLVAKRELDKIEAIMRDAGQEP